jgi:hypothetical protein
MQYEYDGDIGGNMSSVLRKQERDPRRVAWSHQRPEGASALVSAAQAALRARMKPRIPSERDLNELDRRLEMSWEAVEGTSRVPPVYHVASEDQRMVMPHSALEGGEESDLLRRRYNVAEFPPEPASLDAMALARRPEEMAVQLAVELTYPFTLVSANDDALFKSERWRAHTLTDVLRSKADSVPLATEVRPLPPDVASDKQSLVNIRAYDLDPPMQDGRVAWFAGWDAYFDGI